MFWNIFFDSLTLILGILAVGWIIASLVGRRSKANAEQEQ